MLVGTTAEAILLRPTRWDGHRAGMNSTSQDAQTRRVEATSEVDQPFRHADSPEWMDVPDPTEDLANDVTSELAGNGAGPQAGPRPLMGADSIVANDETTGVATAVATGTVLRDRYILGLPLGCGGTSVVPSPGEG